MQEIHHSWAPGKPIDIDTTSTGPLGAQFSPALQGQKVPGKSHCILSILLFLMKEDRDLGINFCYLSFRGNGWQEKVSNFNMLAKGRGVSIG